MFKAFCITLAIMFTSNSYGKVFEMNSEIEFVNSFNQLHDKSYELQSKYNAIIHESFKDSYKCLIYITNKDMLLLLTLNPNYKYLVSSVLLEEINTNLKLFNVRSKLCQTRQNHL